MKRLALLLLVTACAPPEREAFVAEPCGRLQSRPNLDCDRYPELCLGAVGRDVSEPHLSRAVDVVFLGDGFDATEMDDFRAQVHAIVSGAEKDREGIVEPHRELFNFYWVQTISPSHGSVEDADRHDTPLGSCLEPEKIGQSGVPRIVTDDRVARFVATANVEDVDIVVVIVDGTHGRANATKGEGGIGIVRMGRQHGDRTFTHELGHALVSLDDEYVEREGCYAAPKLRAFSTHDDPLWAHPNLSLEPHPVKWKPFVGRGLEGGAGIASCVYHPAERCRMSDADADGFCAICRIAIHRVFLARTANDGDPLCIVSFDGSPRSVRYLEEIHVAARDLDGLARWRLFLDGAPAGGETLDSRGWLASGSEWLIVAFEKDGPALLEAECEDAEGRVTRIAVPITIDNDGRGEPATAETW